MGELRTERIGSVRVFCYCSQNRQEELMTYFRHAAIAAALLAGAGTANAQTTVITREPVQTQTVVTPQTQTVVTQQPLVLSPVQRQTVYRTIVQQPVQEVSPTVEYRVGTRVPPDARLYAMPPQVAVEVPAIKTYKYMRVNDRVVLVDPATSEVVGEVTQ
jgi:hypothetical protein